MNSAGKAPGKKGKTPMSDGRKFFWTIAAALMVSALMFLVALPVTLSDITHSNDSVQRSVGQLEESVSALRIDVQKVSTLAVQTAQLVQDMAQAERLISRLRTDLEELRQDMAAVKASRFRMDDAHEMEVRFVERIEKLGEDIVALERRLPDTFRKQIAPELENLKERLAALERKNG